MTSEQNIVWHTDVYVQLLQRQQTNRVQGVFGGRIGLDRACFGGPFAMENGGSEPDPARRNHEGWGGRLVPFDAVYLTTQWGELGSDFAALPGTGVEFVAGGAGGVESGFVLALGSMGTLIMTSLWLPTVLP